jgi:hypothetical protein
MLDRRLLAVPLLVAAVLPAAARTRVVHVSPLTKSGHVRPGLRVVSTKPGTCLPSSEAVPGAYRCFSDSNLVLDPCWKAGTHTVLCLPNPWARTATRMRVRGRLAKPSGGAASLPWGVKLRGGERCVLLQGASSVVHGRRVNYGCSRTSFLAGRPDRSHRVWRIRRARLASGGRFVLGATAAIATAYYGRV